MTKKLSVAEVRDLIRDAPMLKSISPGALTASRAGMDQMLAE